MTDDARLVVVFFDRDLTDPTEGNQVRVWHLVDQLRRRFGPVTVLKCDGGGDESDLPDGVRVTEFADPLPDFLNDCNPFLYAALTRTLADDTAVVQVESPAGVVASRVVETMLGGDTHVVYDAHNVEGVKAQTHRDPSQPWYKRLLAPYVVPVIERLGVAAADTVLAVSHADRETFVRTYGVDSDAVRVVPSGVETTPDDARPDRTAARERFGFGEETVAVFHGSYNYYPNREAIETLRTDIAPAITETADDVRFAVAGTDVPERDDGEVTCVGFVDDLEAFLHAADVAVVPLARGGGTKLKVLDYLNAGLPIVTTATGAEGLDLTDGEDAIVTEGVNDEFVASLRSLLAHPDERARLGENARERAREYDWAEIGDRLAAVYEGELGDEGRP